MNPIDYIYEKAPPDVQDQHRENLVKKDPDKICEIMRRIGPCYDCPHKRAEREIPF
jgi:hypothetical protein